MTAKTEQQRWRRLSQLFEQMADMPVDARAAFLDSECGGDLPMRAQLERMLALDDAPHVMDEGVGMVLQFEPDETGWIEQAGSERLGHWQLQGMIGTGATGARLLVGVLATAWALRSNRRMSNCASSLETWSTDFSALNWQTQQSLLAIGSGGWLGSAAG